MKVARFYLASFFFFFFSGLCTVQCTWKYAIWQTGPMQLFLYYYKIRIGSKRLTISGHIAICGFCFTLCILAKRNSRCRLAIQQIFWCPDFISKHWKSDTISNDNVTHTNIHTCTLRLIFQKHTFEDLCGFHILYSSGCFCSISSLLH